MKKHKVKGVFTPPNSKLEVSQEDAIIGRKCFDYCKGTLISTLCSESSVSYAIKLAEDICRNHNLPKDFAIPFYAGIAGKQIADSVANEIESDFGACHYFDKESIWEEAFKAFAASFVKACKQRA